MCRMPIPQTHRFFITGSNTGGDPNQLDVIFKQKGTLLSKIRKALKNMSPTQRSQEGTILQAGKRSTYHARRTNLEDAQGIKRRVMSSMNILEAAPLDSDGILGEDVMQACERVDLVILPGLALTALEDD